MNMRGRNRRKTKKERKQNNLEMNVLKKGCKEVSRITALFTLLNIEEFNNSPTISPDSSFFWNDLSRQIIVGEYEFVVDKAELLRNGIEIPSSYLIGDTSNLPRGDILENTRYFIYGKLLFIWDFKLDLIVCIDDLNGGIIFSPATKFQKSKTKERRKKKFKKFLSK